jgi:hypothetical protein
MVSNVVVSWWCLLGVRSISGWRLSASLHVGLQDGLKARQLAGSDLLLGCAKCNRCMLSLAWQRLPLPVGASSNVDGRM